MNKKEILLLKKAYQREKDAKVARRILMVFYSIQEESSWKVSERLQCDHKAVLTWRGRYSREGIAGLQTRPRSGKPTLLSRRQESRIKNKVAEDNPAGPWTTKRVCELIKRETGISYAPRHVRRILQKWDFRLLVPRPTFWQRASGEEIKRFWKKNPVLSKEVS